MQKIGKFFQDCISELRPAGWFSDPIFDDLDAVLKVYTAEVIDAGELEELDAEPDWLQETLPHHFSGLLSLDRSCCAHINMKKAGGEEGRGYYENMVRRLVNCFSDNVSTHEEWTPNEDGWAEIVPVRVSATLRPRWVSDKSADRSVAIEQAFVPMNPWSDLIFIEQILSRLLKDKIKQMMTRVGIDEEWALFVFPPTQAAASALAEFEKRHFSKADRTEFWKQNTTVLPQPNSQNIGEIMKAAGYETQSADVGFETPKTKQKFSVRPLNIVLLILIVFFLLFANSKWAEKLLGVE